MPRDKVDVAKRAVDAFNRRDVDGFFAELATRDFELYAGTVRALGGDVHRGREGVEWFDRDRTENWEELQTVAEEFREAGDGVLVLGRQGGTWKEQRRRGRCTVGDDHRLSRRQDLSLPGVLRSRRGAAGGRTVRVDAGF